jgi:hypothetical protein
MELSEALEIVVDTAHDWAGEYGFAYPDAAIRVFQAAKVVEGELMKKETDAHDS